MQDDSSEARHDFGIEDLIVLVGAGAWIVGLVLPALSWTASPAARSQPSEPGTAGIRSPTGASSSSSCGAPSFSGVVALVAPGRGAIATALAAAFSATALAAFWALALPGNVEQVHDLIYFTVDDGAITVEPWIWVPAIGHAIVVVGLCLSASIVSRAKVATQARLGVPLAGEPVPSVLA